jgi:hypothetical protein
MNYYIDTEFVEGKQSKSLFGINIGYTKPTIDLISIGIVADSGHEYYAISKDFNLSEAWNRVQVTSDKYKNSSCWIRENVLYPIFEELSIIENDKRKRLNINPIVGFTYKNMKYLLNVYGESNDTIAKEIELFIADTNDYKPVFYGYYCAYDWVVFCQLFGIMLKLPTNFPYYCKDLKQIANTIWEATGKDTRYTKNNNAHHALNDAKWNKEFHYFLEFLTRQNT